MHSVSARLGAAILLSFAALAAPARADVTVGVPSMGSNCYPFGCGYTGEYQQVYGSTAFAGPTTINTVQFFLSPDWPLTSNASSFTLNFYLTSKPVDGLSTSAAANETTLLSSFGTFVPGTNYSFTGNSFIYDPSQGNLLLDITTTGAPSDTNGMYFSSANNDAMSNLYRSGGTGAYTTGTNGLVTRFAQVSPVPEPSTWALLLVGFFGIGVAMRRRPLASTNLLQIA